MRRYSTTRWQLGFHSAVHAFESLVTPELRPHSVSKAFKKLQIVKVRAVKSPERFEDDV